jgi:hypothetical protein
MIRTVFAFLIVLGFLVNSFHDWIDIPGWTHGRQVRAAVGSKKMLIGTAINSVFPGLAAAFAIYYWHRPAPPGVLNYWLIYCAVMVFGAIMMWWVPYFRGTNQKTKDLYSKMYAGTLQVLPPHGDNPRPNVFHLFAHALGLSTLTLAVVLRLGIA